MFNRPQTQIVWAFIVGGQQSRHSQADKEGFRPQPFWLGEPVLRDISETELHAPMSCFLRNVGFKEQPFCCPRFTATVTSDDVPLQSGFCMSVGRRMTSGCNSHLSCTPKWSKGFETNTAGQQILSERLFLGAIFTNGTGKGLNPLPDSSGALKLNAAYHNAMPALLWRIPCSHAAKCTHSLGRERQLDLLRYKLRVY